MIPFHINYWFISNRIIQRKEKLAAAGGVGNNVTWQRQRPFLNPLPGLSDGLWVSPPLFKPVVKLVISFKVDKETQTGLLFNTHTQNSVAEIGSFARVCVCVFDSILTLYLNKAPSGEHFLFAAWKHTTAAPHTTQNKSLILEINSHCEDRAPTHSYCFYLLWGKGQHELHGVTSCLPEQMNLIVVIGVTRISAVW